MSKEEQPIPMWRDKDGNWRNDRLPTVDDCHTIPVMTDNTLEQELDNILDEMYQLAVRGNDKRIAYIAPTFQQARDYRDWETDRKSVV